MLAADAGWDGCTLQSPRDQSARRPLAVSLLFFSIGFFHRLRNVIRRFFKNSTFLHSTTAPEEGANRALARQSPSKALPIFDISITGGAARKGAQKLICVRGGVFALWRISPTRIWPKKHALEQKMTSTCKSWGSYPAIPCTSRGFSAIMPCVIFCPR